MTDSEREAKTAELAELQALRKVREKKPGYAANVAKIDKMIATLKAELASPTA